MAWFGGLVQKVRAMLDASDLPAHPTDPTGNPVQPADRTALAAGNRALAEGRLAEAIADYQAAVTFAPGNADAHLRLGYALQERGCLAEAEDALKTSLALAPGQADVLFMLGALAQQRHDYEGAADRLQAALRLDPTIQPAYTGVALALFRLRRTSEALALLSDGIRHFPADPQLLFFQGNFLAESGDFSSAAASYKKSLQISPNDASTLANLGNCERHLGHTDEAIQYLRQAIELQPANAAWHSNLLFTLQYTRKLAPEELFREHLRYAQRFEDHLKAHWPDHAAKARPSDQRLRIGYVSGDFRDHALSYFFEPILLHHHRERVEVFCYYTYPIHDRITSRLAELSDHWRDCADLSDDEMATQITADSIDVLVDLSGHTGYNRLTVFARKPAPVQITWLGYQATTGLSAMDYRISDSGIDPDGMAERFHSEKLMRLPMGAVFQPDADSPAVNPLPALDFPFFTFACLNNPAKITDQFIAAAARILRETEGTRLLFGNATEQSIALLTASFAAEGIHQNRLAFAPRLASVEYLRLHHTIDLALDTFPYNGGTTTLHSHWMGVPVLAVEGDSTLSRVGVQILRSLGLDRFVCSDMDTYVASAVALSKDRQFMQTVRAGLRARMEAVSVNTAQAFTELLEQHFMAARLKVSQAPSADKAWSH